MAAPIPLWIVVLLVAAAAVLLVSVLSVSSAARPSNTTPTASNGGDSQTTPGSTPSGRRLYRWPGEPEKTRLDGNGPSAEETYSTPRANNNSTGSGVNAQQHQWLERQRRAYTLIPGRE